MEEMLELHCEICGISAKSTAQQLYNRGWLWAEVCGESLVRCRNHWQDAEVRAREMLRDAGIRR